MQYETERAAAKRGEAIQDAQKRRLYRRAHGMEDLEKEGVGEGIDVRGLVAWDDGLTRGERERERERAGVGDDASPVSRNTAGEEEEEKRVRRPVKKWLGIW